MKNLKIQYIPSMLSLFFVLVLVVLHFNSYFKDSHSIVIFIPSSEPVHFHDKTNLSETPFKTSICSLAYNKRKFTEYNLVGNLIIDSILLDSFDMKMRKIIESKDSNNGLHVVFGNNIKYNSFIRTLDICLINCKKFSIQNYFILYENSLWFLYDKNHLKRDIGL